MEKRDVDLAGRENASSANSRTLTRVKRPMMVTKRTTNLPLICLICGDTARGINYDVMSCMSCKTFFRRHAQRSTSDLVCKVDNHCKITKQTRGSCSSCRLQKCYTLGMNHQLLRRWSTNQYKSQQSQDMTTNANNDVHLPEPTTLSLLQNDRSTLSSDEWQLLSNVVHAYDQTSIVPHIKTLLEQQASLPPKFCSKISASVDVLKLFLSALQPFVESSPSFRSLSVNARQTLIQHNFDMVCTMNCVFIIREISALDNRAFLASCDTVYGYDIFKYSTRFVARLEPNGTLVKLLLLTLVFSTNCSIVAADDLKGAQCPLNAAAILDVQNTLATMFWKYLLYQYGFSSAVQRFSCLIKYILDLLQSINEKSTVEHKKMIGTIVDQSTQSLSTANNDDDNNNFASFHI